MTDLDRMNAARQTLAQKSDMLSSAYRQATKTMDGMRERLVRAEAEAMAVRGVARALALQLRAVHGEQSHPDEECAACKALRSFVVSANGEHDGRQVVDALKKLGACTRALAALVENRGHLCEFGERPELQEHDPMCAAALKSLAAL